MSFWLRVKHVATIYYAGFNAMDAVGSGVTFPVLSGPGILGGMRLSSGTLESRTGKMHGQDM